MSGIAVGTVASAAIGAIAGSRSSKKAEKARQASILEQQRQRMEDRQWAIEDWTRAIEANKGIADQNWQRQLDAMKTNRINQSSNFGGVTYDQDGNQIVNLAPELQAKLGSLRGQYDTNIEQLGQQFDENSPVYQALRNQQLRGRQGVRDAENARLAAMGLSTGSGSAWQAAQEAQNLADVQAEESAWLGGLNAFNSTQANARNNLGALSGLESAWNTNAQRLPDFWKTTASQQGQMNPIGSPQGINWGVANQAGEQAGEGEAGKWNSIAQGIGGLTKAGVANGWFTSGNPEANGPIQLAGPGSGR